jgi:hypothetical protein
MAQRPAPTHIALDRGRCLLLNGPAARASNPARALPMLFDTKAPATFTPRPHELLPVASQTGTRT